MAFHKRPFKCVISKHLFVLDRVINGILFEFCIPGIVICDCIKKFSLLFKQVHFHTSSQHVVAIFDDLIVSLRVGKKTVKKVVLLFGGILCDDFFSQSKFFFFSGLFLGFIFDKEKWVV